MTKLLGQTEHLKVLVFRYNSFIHCFCILHLNLIGNVVPGQTLHFTVLFSPEYFQIAGPPYEKTKSSGLTFPIRFK